MRTPEASRRPQRFGSMLTLPTLLTLLSGAACLTGCVSFPAESLSEPVEVDELSTHVTFLAQPALKGRKPKTRGSAFARSYIRSRFKSYGLVPWGNAKKYAQSFGLGTNMIGVLPGADPNLATEIVIVSAHYDHLGKTDKGRCLGASDNASGVAALLEIAEQLALGSERPRRSICFAAFDCEETFTLGALAFTCREDYHESSIVGVVNIDMLGRDAFSLLDNSLFMTGTKDFPDLREQIRAGVPEEIALLPIGTEIAGPRGDHIAFETLDSPVLFFSCGPHADYHRPTDTAEKLNYDGMQHSVEVIVGAVDALANSANRYRRDTSEAGDLEELQAIKSCLSQVRAGYDVMGWTETQAALLDPLLAQVDRLLDAPRYTRQDRLDLLRNAMNSLMPLAAWPDSPDEPNDPNQLELSDSMIVLQTVFTEHRPLFVDEARIIVKHLLSERTNLLLGRATGTGVIKWEVPDHLIFVETVERARYRLSFLSLTLTIFVDINRHSGIRIRVNYSLDPSEFTGTRDELTDYGLLLCHNSDSRMWLALLRHITGASNETAYEQTLQSRLAAGHWANESEWILDRAHSENPRLRYMALAMLPRVLGAEAEPILLDALADPNATTTDRKAVVASLNADSSPQMLLAIADILSDQTQIKHRLQTEYERLTRPDTPFKGYPLLPLTIKNHQTWIEENLQEPWTMADYAHERLRGVTHHNLDKDTVAWRQWIEANRTNSAN